MTCHQLHNARAPAEISAMAAISTFPSTGQIVRGDPLTIPVRIKIDGVAQDISTWTWRAHVRSNPDRTLVTEFAIDFDQPDDETVPCRVLMRLDSDQTQILKNGYGFDLEQLTPVHLTWWIATIGLVKDYSHG